MYCITKLTFNNLQKSGRMGEKVLIYTVALENNSD